MEASQEGDELVFPMKPVGVVQSSFSLKNGTPRQGSICAASRARIRFTYGTNPSHSLQDLAPFSHVWVLWVFHANKKTSHVKAKVRPPRLGGKRVGLFSTRTPHRPNPIGLSLCTLERVDGDTVYLSGVDMITGTPVLDIKPYIPSYDNPDLFPTRPLADAETTTSTTDTGSVEIGQDSVDVETHAQSDAQPQTTSTHTKTEGSGGQEQGQARTSEYTSPASVTGLMQTTRFSVCYSDSAEHSLASVFSHNLAIKGSLLTSGAELRSMIEHILSNEPRSVYRRSQLAHEPYRFLVDRFNVTAQFAADAHSVTVQSIEPVTGDEAWLSSYV